ncbi:MAG: UDP-N-acetylmuramoyl-tripeptide--D-alanyl-D-alanine ligase, partial [Nitriliruptoraceae bacterium]
MIALTVDEIAGIICGRLRGEGTTPIDRVCTDTRTLRDDASRTLFVALTSDTGDGHDFVAEAVAAGVGAVLVEHPTDATCSVIEVDDTLAALTRLAGVVRDVVNPKVVAVTGSVGKTTVKDLIAAALASRYRVVASRASFNNALGVPLTLLEIVEDTEVLVVEIGARHRGDIAPLAALARPDIAVVTAVAPVHLEIFGSIDAIASTKAELVAALDASGVAVLNVGWERVAEMVARAPRDVRVGTDDADVRASNIELDDHARARFMVHTPAGQAEVTAPLPGRHQVDNVLLALAVAGVLDVPLADAATAIAGASVPPMRGDVVQVGTRTIIDDTYNANPTAVRAALDLLVELAQGRPTIAVLGEMAEIGPTSEAEHRAVGAACAERGISAVIACGAAAASIAEGARDAGHGDVVELRSAGAAAEW